MAGGKPDSDEGAPLDDELRRRLADRAIERGRRHYRLTIGELFPDGDVVGQWVFGVTALVEDLQVLHKALRENPASDDLRASLFFYRQLVTRLYEARRLATAVRNDEAIGRFAGELIRQPPGGIDLEQVYRKDPVTKKSIVEGLYEDLRNRTVHALKPSSDELRDLLWNHSGYPAQIQIQKSEDATPDVWFQWVQAVTAGDVYGDVSDPEFLSKMNQRSKLAAAIAMSWGMIASLAVPLHAGRVGVDLERLGTLPQDAE